MTENEVVARAFREAGLEQSAFTYVAKPGPVTPLRTYMSDDRVLTVALDAEGRRQNLIEQACRVWAKKRGVRSPVIVDFAREGDWLHAERVRVQSPQGPLYVHAALDAADRVAGGEPPVISVPPSQWRSSSSPRVGPVIRGVLGGLNPVTFVQSRRAAAELTDLTTCHGDFYRRNVLFGESGMVSIVDWEFVGRAPRWTDHLRFWSTLRRPEDRNEAWNRLLDTSRDHTRHLSILTHWLCQRLLAENLASPPALRNFEDLKHARRLAVEGRRLSAELR